MASALSGRARNTATIAPATMNGTTASSSVRPRPPSAPTDQKLYCWSSWASVSAIP